MKTTMKFAGLMLTATISLLTSGCNNVAKQQEIERQHQAELAEKKRVEQGKLSFTTSKGTFDIEKTIDECYNFGVNQGSLDRSVTYPVYHSDGDGTEKGFKFHWSNNYGIPNNETAKDVYNRALKKYIQGYDDGWNF